ncbi:hypothetical protein ACFLS4_01500 [Bacteroidota bacterium]
MKTFKLIIGIALYCLISGNSQAQNNIPELNKEIIKYVETVIGKKVDRGECWDLANQSLTLVNADWDKAYVYGNSIDPNKDEVFPGDLIQFKNVKVQYTEGNATYTEFMNHHTAVVYKVISKGVFEIAHQNTEFSGRKVGISTLNLNHIVKGKLYFYRPTQNLENK